MKSEIIIIFNLKIQFEISVMIDRTLLFTIILSYLHIT
jgi:hypothetical protein